MELPSLTTERLVVRMANGQDVPRIVTYFREQEAFLAPFSPIRPPDFLTESYWHERVGQSAVDFTEDRSLRMFVFNRSGGEILGTCSFTQFERGPAQYCTLGFGLGEQTQGRGLMAEALRPALAFVFDALRMHRVMANYMPHNRRSGRLLQRLGFVVDGYARDYLLIAGRWEDHVLTSLINPQHRGG